MLELITALVELTAVLVAAGVAVFGVQAWRREHVGRKRIDTAEEILEEFYAARDILSHIRHPAGFAGEGRTRQRRDGETQEESEILDRAYVPIERYLEQADRLAKLRALKYRAQAYWGPSAVEPFDTFEKIVNEVLSAAQMVATFWRNDYARRGEGHVRQLLKLEAKIWAGGEDDTLTPLTEAMIEQAERLCGPVIATLPNHTRATRSSGRLAALRKRLGKSRGDAEPAVPPDG